MKTVTYQEVFNQAAEAAGRTRDKVPAKEALMLQGFLAVALREVWNGQYQWPELIPAPISVVTAAGVFSKLEGQAGEMGDVLGVWTANPLVTPNYLACRFDEQDGQVQLEEGGGTVWVEYMWPRLNLNAIAAANLPGTTLPERFANYLAFTAAGMLVRADGQMAQGDEILALAQSEIQIELGRVVEVPRRAVRKRQVFQMPVMAAQPPQGR